MAKLSNEFKEKVKETAITVFINAIGTVLKSIGETLINSKKIEEVRKETVYIDNDKV